MVIKNCKFCKKEFLGKNPAIYCNTQCRKDENSLITNKTCTKCKEYKKIEEFYISNSKVNARKVVCKSCDQSFRKERKSTFSLKWKEAEKRRKLKWGRDYPEKCRNSRLKSVFGITSEEYNDLSEKQNHNCAICNEKETKVSKISGELKRLAVDHCHTTNKIRGLLCFHCNSSLGKFKDSIENLERAIEYLKKSREE